MSSAHPSASPGHFALAVAAVWVELFVFYILFTGSFSVNEVLVGAGAAGLACFWWAAAGRRGGMRFSGWTGHLRPIGRAILSLPGATIKVAGELWRAAIHGGPPGEVAYERDADSAWATAEAPAARALGLIAASLAPDTYILREKGGDAGIIDHSLSPRESAR